MSTPCTLPGFPTPPSSTSPTLPVMSTSGGAPTESYTTYAAPPRVAAPATGTGSGSGLWLLLALGVGVVLATRDSKGLHGTDDEPTLNGPKRAHRARPRTQPRTHGQHIARLVIA